MRQNLPERLIAHWVRLTIHGNQQHARYLRVLLSIMSYLAIALLLGLTALMLSHVAPPEFSNSLGPVTNSL